MIDITKCVVHTTHAAWNIQQLRQHTHTNPKHIPTQAARHQVCRDRSPARCAGGPFVIRRGQYHLPSFCSASAPHSCLCQRLLLLSCSTCRAYIEGAAHAELRLRGLSTSHVPHDSVILALMESIQGVLSLKEMILKSEVIRGCLNARIQTEWSGLEQQLAPYKDSKDPRMGATACTSHLRQATNVRVCGQDKASVTAEAGAKQSPS
eukprot:scaffold261992_cov20-Tisochrysis_lutea.AAC.1